MENYDDIFSGTTDRRDNGQFDKEAWAAKKQAERDGVYTMIDTYAHEMSIDGDLFSSYLDVQARFDRYSVSNAILIAAQCPEATKLADFDTWKASGLYVKRGADAITILEPGKEYTPVRKMAPPACSMTPRRCSTFHRPTPASGPRPPWPVTGSCC